MREGLWVSIQRYNMRVHNFQKMEIPSIFSNVGCLNLSHVGCWKKRKTYIHCSHLKHSSLLLWLPSLPGRWAEPIQIPGVLCLAAWQAVPHGKSAPLQQPWCHLFPTLLPPTQPYHVEEQSEPGPQPESQRSPNGARQFEDMESKHFWEMLSPCIVIWQIPHYPTRPSLSPFQATVSFVKNSPIPPFYLQCCWKIFFITFFLSSRGSLWDIFQLSLVDN